MVKKQNSENYILLRKLIKGSIGIILNSSDFFNYSTAYSILIEDSDLDWILPIFNKHGWTGINACMAYITSRKPMDEYLTKEYEDAYNEIVSINPKIHLNNIG